MLILSGLLGLVRPETRIRFYDKLLLPQDISPMVDLVSHQWLWFGVDQVEYFTRDVQCNAEVRPYITANSPGGARKFGEAITAALGE
jgi:hypothetical protein